MHKKKTIIFIRRLSQAAFFAGILYIIWQTKYPLNSPLNPSLYFKLDPFAMLVTALSERVLLTGLLYAIFTLIMTFIFGRVFCGWFCPLGAMQDLWAYVPGLFKRKYSEKKPSKSVVIKYIILAIVSVLAVFGMQAAWVIDPIAIFVRAFSLNIFPFMNKAVDSSFIYILRSSDIFTPLEKLYYYFKDNIIALNNPVFPHSLAVFILLVLVLALASYKRRFWCRYICPLGAMLAVVSRYSLLGRHTGTCKGSCALCRARCRMNAIRSDNSYIKQECVLCMDCTQRCPGGYSKFTFHKNKRHAHEALNDKGISRAQFLAYLAGAIAFISGTGSRLFGGASSSNPMVIRPPASLPEEKFVERCIRCGNCMKVCPTNVLQPALLESGLSGIWTPKFDTRIGYCEYKCNLCTQVCPTSAINKITADEKMQTRMGLAEIDQRLCLPWAKGTECIVCEEHCPIAEKAIKLVETKGRNGIILKLPSVDPDLCVGCAICEFKCPVGPNKAITVKPL